MSLNELKRQNKQAAGGDDTKKKKKQAEKGDDEEPDIEGLMNDLREDIERIYKYLEGNAAALDAKASIEILQEIELKLNEHMKVIKYVHDFGSEYYIKVRHGVDARRAAKQAEVREKINEEIRLKNEAMQAKLVAKEKLSVKKFGKPSTIRSSKPKIKQKTVKKVVDEETQDQLNYL